jgi:hypothetical protein
MLKLLLVSLVGLVCLLLDYHHSHSPILADGFFLSTSSTPAVSTFTRRLHFFHSMTPSSQGTTEKKKKSQAFHPSKINFNECYYSVLGVNTTADLVTLTKAYDRIVFKYAIPLMAKTEGNMTASDDKFHELMIILNQAYLVLRNPETRQKYDEQRKKGLIGIHSGIRVFKEEPRACPEHPAPLKKNLTVLPPTSLFPADTSKRAFSDAKNDTTTESIYEVFDPWEYDDDHTPWDSRDEDLANLSDVVKDHRKLCVRMGELMDHTHSFAEMEVTHCLSFLTADSMCTIRSCASDSTR